DVAAELATLEREPKRLVVPDQLADMPDMRKAELTCRDPPLGREHRVRVDEIGFPSTGRIRHDLARATRPGGTQPLPNLCHRPQQARPADLLVPPVELREHDLAAHRVRQPP